MGEAIRIYNLVSAIALLGLTIVAVALKWERLDPIRRLFSLSLLGFFVYALATSAYGLAANAEFRWYTMVLAISNTWMIVSVFILTRRPLPSSDLLGTAEKRD